MLEEILKVLKSEKSKPLSIAQIEQRRKACEARLRKTAPKPPSRSPSKPAALALSEPTNPTQILIGTYVASWQARYGTKARPDVTNCIGVFRKLLRERSVTEISELVQVYCQMNDEWIKRLHHDIGTFSARIGQVALARDKGFERPNGEKHWTEIVAEREAEGKNDLAGIRPPNR